MSETGRERDAVDAAQSLTAQGELGQGQCVAPVTQEAERSELAELEDTAGSPEQSQDPRYQPFAPRPLRSLRVRQPHEQLKRVLRLGIAAISLSIVFGITLYQSRGRWQFAWDPNSLLAQPRLSEGVYDLSSIAVLNHVLLQVQENYVDPSRCEPRRMLAAGLNEIQQSVPEIVASFDAPIADSPSEVLLSVGRESKRFRFDDVDSLWDMSLKFREVFRFVQEHLGEGEPREIEYAAVNGILGTLDPHSTLLSPKAYRDMVEGNRGKFGGLGILVRMVEGRLTVIEPMKGETPASKVGIIKGDVIVDIDGVATLNMSISEAVELLRGEAGTKVQLLVDRPSEKWEQPRPFEVTRDEIKIESVSSRMLGDGVAYVALSGFQSNTYKDMATQLEALENAESVRGLVMDLRGNPGGLLEQAIEISDHFVRSGNIVTTVGSGHRLRKSYEAKDDGNEPRYPVIVLIDSSSASASEIVAGALKNLDRALIVGESSFGKGSVQVLYELQDGSALKLTVAQYLTPGDVSIQSVGIVPDVQLEPMIVDAQKMRLHNRAWVRREADLSSHLDHESAKSGERPGWTLRYLANEAASLAESDEELEAPADDEAVPAEETSELAPDEDPQLRVAQRLLLAILESADESEHHERAALLSRLPQLLAEVSAAEDKALTARLETLEVDWSSSNMNNRPRFSVRIASSLEPASELDLGAFPQADVVMPAGARVLLDVSVHNDGDEPITRLFAATRSTLDPFDGRELAFGRVEPGASVTRRLEASTHAALRSRLDMVDVDFDVDELSNTREDALLSQRYKVLTVGREMPSFSMSYVILDELGCDGMAEPEERIEVLVQVHNEGKGESPEPLALLRNLSGAQVYLHQAREQGTALAPSATTRFSFSLTARPVDEQPLQLEVQVYDKVLGRNSTAKLEIPVRLEASGVKSVQQDGGVLALTMEELLRARPAEDAAVLARVGTSSTVQVQCETAAKDWCRVSVGEQQGWLRSKVLSVATEPESVAVVPFFSVSPVQVRFEALPLSTDETELSLRGELSDDVALDRILVYVTNESEKLPETRKVYFESFNTKTAKFDIPLGLSEGLNRIRFVATDSAQLERTEYLYVNVREGR
ncbi:MAG: MXAN_5808 family serine peptidase [Myxococcota bacterium]|nr:MXAN_5808 family serine peptidase [Myxococcota bacterium]